MVDALFDFTSTVFTPRYMGARHAPGSNPGRGLSPRRSKTAAAASLPLLGNRLQVTGVLGMGSKS